MSDESHLFRAHPTGGSLAGVTDRLATIVWQADALHAQGRLHGNLFAATFAGAAAAVDSIELAALDPGLIPWECEFSQLDRVPVDLQAASAVLAKASVKCDPRRFDLAQMAAVAIRLSSNLTIEQYLNSPNAKSQLVPSLREIVDRLLGFEAGQQFKDCGEVLAALQSSGTPALGADTPPGGSVIAADMDTPAFGHRKAVSGAEPVQVLGEADQWLGKYRLVEKIGAGGMGDVYRAYEPDLDRHVALKLLPPSLSRHEEFVRRFKSEATAAARLGHPNIVRVFAIGEDRGVHFFVMEFVEGESLADRLRREGKLSHDETLRLAEQALEGLAAAHHAGMVHRDIKPGNILLDRRHQRVMLADFGLVKSVQAGASMTETGVVMGTADYISPEQARGKKVDGRTDLYALGVLMYQCLSGRLPFEADSPTAMIFQHAYEQPRPISEVAEIPLGLSQVIDRLMAKSPEDRYATAADVLADLRRVCAGEPLGGQPAGEAIPPEYSAEQSRAGYETLFRRLIRRRMPGVVERYANTCQQIDFAIDDYRQRHEDMGQLVADAEAVLQDLRRQATAQRSAFRASPDQADHEASADQRPSLLAQAHAAHLAAEELEKQVAAQAEQVEELRTHLVQVKAKLGTLQCQRDALKARFAAAQRESGLKPSRWRARRFAALGGGVLSIVAFIVAGIVTFNAGGKRPAIGDGPEVDSHTAAPPIRSPQSGIESIMADAVVYYDFESSSIYKQAEQRYLASRATGKLDSQVNGPILESAGHDGFALGFDGIDDSLSLPGVREAILRQPEAISIACWVHTSPSNAEGTIFDVGQFAHSGITLRVESQNRFNFVLPEAHGGINLHTSPHSDGWHHVVGVWDGKRQLIYVDGIEKSQGSTTNLRLDTDSVTNDAGSVGTQATQADDRGGRRFAGLLDEFLIVSRALSPAEVVDLYQSSSQEMLAGLNAVGGLASIDKQLRGDEANSIVAAVREEQRQVLEGIANATLIAFYEANEFKRNGGGLATLADSYSKQVVQGAGQEVFTWGISEQLNPGSYLAVYRLQLREASGGDELFLELAGNGKAVGGHRPTTSTLSGGEWSHVAVRFDLDSRASFEFRLWPFGNRVALDRVYLFRLIDHVPNARLVRAFEGHSDRITSTFMSANGKRLASGSHDGTARVWDVESGSQLDQFSGFGGRVTDVELSANGRVLAVACNQSKSLTTYELAAGRQLSKHLQWTNGFEKFNLSADGSRAIMNGNDWFRVVDTASGKELYTGKESSYAVAISPDGKRVAFGGGDRAVSVYRIDGWFREALYKGQNEKIYALSIAGDGKSAASSGPGKEIHVWDLETGQRKQLLTGHVGEVGHLALSHDGTWLLSRGNPNEARLWSVPAQREVVRWGNVTSPRPSLSSDGRRVLLGREEVLELWEQTSDGASPQ